MDEKLYRAKLKPDPELEFEMHLLEVPSSRLGLDHNRRENAWDARRGHDDILKQLQCVGAATVGNCAEIPYDGTLCVEIGGQNQESAAFAMLGSNLLKDRRRDEALDHPSQRIGSQQA